MRRIICLFFLLALLLPACGLAPAPVTLTPTTEPSKTPAPTATFVPTATLTPTITPSPTATVVLTPTPLVFPDFQSAYEYFFSVCLGYKLDGVPSGMSQKEKMQAYALEKWGFVLGKDYSVGGRVEETKSCAVGLLTFPGETDGLLFIGPDGEATYIEHLDTNQSP